jgi:hypothetical protein
LTSCNAKSHRSSKCLSGLSPDALCRFNSYLSTKLNIR